MSMTKGKKTTTAENDATEEDKNGRKKQKKNSMLPYNKHDDNVMERKKQARFDRFPWSMVN
jgi:hypothetical protein